MAKFFPLLLIILFSTATFSQTNPKTLEELSKQIAANPDNPLNIDQTYLLSLAQQVNNPQLKNILATYATNLQADPDLSYRQVYQEIATALEANPGLLSTPAYSQTAQKLDALLNNYNALTDKMQKIANSKYEFGMFVNDPDLIAGLGNITGSYESAMGVGLGVEFILSVADIIAENKKFREDYIKLAAVSRETVYAEKDANLPNALLDACVLISCNDSPENGNKITPMYRYDFSNGASLRVENGVLKYFGPTGTSKPLLKVQKKHDGEFYKFTSRVSMPTILISPDEKRFYIYSPSDAMLDTNASKDLKYIKTGGHIFNAETGDEIYHTTKTLKPETGGEPHRFTDLGLSYYTFTHNPEMYRYIVTDAKIKDWYLLYRGNPALKSLTMPSSLYYADYVVEKQNALSCVRWDMAYGQTFTSSFIIANADKNGFSNADGMPNELTGLTQDSQGNAYFVSGSGKLGRINAADYVHDASLTGKIRKALSQNVLVRPYDFVADEVIAKSLHGSASGVRYYIPRLKITPDDKYLVYTVSDSLYVIDPKNLSEIKRFGLSAKTHNFNFSKENGDWILNIFATNDFRYPMHKKYSLEKLSKMNTVRIKPKTQTAAAAPVATTNQPNSSDGQSLAGQIKELNELKQQGIITQAEFDAAKAKLLGTPAEKSTGNKTSKTKDVFNYTIDGIAYCAVKAPNDSEFFGLYTYSGKEPCFGQAGVMNNGPGEPIVQLDTAESLAPDGRMARTGKWQAHCAPAIDIWWWLESDCTGNVSVEKGVLGNRYILVMQSKNGDKTFKPNTFKRAQLDDWTDGSNKVVIFGERVKKKR